MINVQDQPAQITSKGGPHSVVDSSIGLVLNTEIDNSYRPSMPQPAEQQSEMGSTKSEPASHYKGTVVKKRSVVNNQQQRRMIRDLLHSEQEVSNIHSSSFSVAPDKQPAPGQRKQEEAQALALRAAEDAQRGYFSFGTAGEAVEGLMFDRGVPARPMPTADLLQIQKMTPPSSKNATAVAKSTTGFRGKSPANTSYQEKQVMVTNKHAGAAKKVGSSAVTHMIAKQKQVLHSKAKNEDMLDVFSNKVTQRKQNARSTLPSRSTALMKQSSTKQRLPLGVFTNVNAIGPGAPPQALSALGVVAASQSPLQNISVKPMGGDSTGRGRRPS